MNRIGKIVLKMKVFQATVEPISVVHVESATLVEELKPEFKKVFRDIKHLLIFRLEEEIDLDRFKTLLERFHLSMLGAKEVANRHLTQADAVWNQSKEHLKEEVLQVEKVLRNLRFHKLIGSFQVHNLYKLFIMNFKAV